MCPFSSSGFSLLLLPQTFLPLEASAAPAAHGAQRAVPGRYTSTPGSQQGGTSTRLTREPVKET